MKAMGAGTHGRKLPLSEAEVFRLASESAKSNHELNERVQIPGRTQWRHARVVHAAAALQGLSCSEYVTRHIVPLAYDAIGWEAPPDERSTRERIAELMAARGVDSQWADQVVLDALERSAPASKAAARPPRKQPPSKPSQPKGGKRRRRGK